MTPQQAVAIILEFEERIADDATGDLVFRRRVNELLMRTDLRSVMLDENHRLVVLGWYGLSRETTIKPPAAREVELAARIEAAS